MPRAVLIALGDELVDGRVPDSNSSWLARQLTEHGIVVSAQLCEGDALEEIGLALDYASRRGELLLVTGGLGPTEDDRTREAVARWAGQKLVENAEAWASIQDYFRGKGLRLAQSNRRQALLPEGATLISNQAGTAPGFQLHLPRGQKEGGPCELFVLPGVPGEMRRMFLEQVLPRVLPFRTDLVQRSLVFGGVSEAWLGQLFAEYLREGGELRVGMCAEFGCIRVTARGYGPQAGQKIEALFQEFRDRARTWYLGEGEGGLEVLLVRELIARGLSLTLAESCTAGLVVSRLAQASGLSQVLDRAYVTYANEAKEELLGVPSTVLETQGAVSAACARAMALGVRRAAGADLGCAVTGIAGPEGGSRTRPVGLVYLAVASRDRIWTLERRYGQPGRQVVRNRAATDLLLLLFQALRGEGGEPLDSLQAS